MKTSWIAATATVIILSLWMLSGLLDGDSTNEDQESNDGSESTIMAVEVQSAEVIVMAREIDLQGQLEPLRHLLLKAQTSGAIEEIFERKGARVSAGDAIVQLDRGGRLNTLAEASASVKTARSEQSAAKSLREQRLQSQVQLEQADAALESAMARLASIELDIDNTTITAAFDAVVNNIPVEIGALIERGDTVAELVDDSTFKVSAQASQQILSQLTPGQAVSMSLLTGETLEGSLTYISAVANPQSRTFTVEAQVVNPGSTIASGVTATMHIPVEEVQATFITPSALSLGEDGKLGVKAINDEDIVEFLPITLVSSALDGAWVSGIPDGQRVITLGQGFVNVGELVDPQTPSNR